jgi:glutamate 5-kinase
MTPLHDASLIVVKIGTSLMRRDPAERQSWLASLASDVASLHARGTDMLVVSSGAVGFGRDVLGLGDGVLSLAQKQAASAAGQPHLIAAWHEALMQHQLQVAQILMGIEDSQSRPRYLNARNTLKHLLEKRIIPIVNENDTVATAEFRVGDNDRLAARVAAMIGADQLILLSDVDGLYSAPPDQEGAQHIARAEMIDQQLIAGAAGPSSATASGGMRTKLEAADIATQAGCHTVIASGVGAHPLQVIMDGARHTHFVAATTPLQARKQWIAGSLQLLGGVHIDAGAVAALQEGNSLLPIGITAVEGAYDQGDTIGIYGPDGTLIAKGITAYTSQETEMIMRQQADAIVDLLGYNGPDNVVHRDDLVMERMGV